MSERAERITCPDDFDPEDIEIARHLVPDGAFVEQMMIVVAWTEPATMERRWRCYNATAEGLSVSGCVGLLEMAKLDMINRSDAWGNRPDPSDDV